MPASCSGPAFPSRPCREILHPHHLKSTGREGLGFSGLGIRFRELEAEEVEQCECDAAAILGPEATALAFASAYQREGICRMLQQVTDGPVILNDAAIAASAIEAFNAAKALLPEGEQGKLSPEPFVATALSEATKKALDTAKWLPVTVQDLKAPGGFKRFGFKTKDYQFLKFVYRRFHEFMQGELAELLGKLHPVAFGD